MGRLLERDSELARLHGWLIEAVAGHGRTAFVGGEAGIGKSALVSELARSAPPAVRVAVGRCDALQTPRVLGPFLEVASALGLDTTPDRDALLATLLGALRDGPPTLAVIEDAHWADDTTIELIALLGRRAVDLPLLLVVTYREAEVTADHPLRLVLGDLASASGAVWLGLQPLSLAAVRELAAGTDAPAEEIHQRTGGNPFFVTEALAAPAAAVPTSVRLAVLARAGRLPPTARDVLDAVAIVPGRAEPWLVEQLCDPAPGAIDACLGSGVLVAEDGMYAFRHELARMAVELDLTDERRRALHQRAVVALADHAEPGSQRASPTTPKRPVTRRHSPARPMDAQPAGRGADRSR